MNIYMVFILVYLLVVLLFGFWVQKNLVKSSSDFWIGGAKLGLLVSSCTVAATFLSGGSLIGYPSMYYASGGFAAPWHMIGTVVCWIIIVLFFVHKIRRTNHVTIVDLFEERYGPRARIIAAILNLYIAVGYLVLNVAGIGAVLSAVLGWSWSFSIILGFAVLLIYVLASGYLGVVWTDVVQFFIMVVGVIMVAIISVNMAGGFEVIKNTIMSDVPWYYSTTGLDNYFDPQTQWRLIIMFGIANLAYAPYYVRILSAKNEIVAKNSFIIAGAANIFVWILLLVTAAAGRVLLPNLQVVNDNFMPVLITSTLPTIAGAVLLCAIIAAIMSSVDSILHVAGVTVARDIYQRMKPDAPDSKLISVSRWAILVVGVVSVAIAIANPAMIFNILVFVWTFVANGLAIPVMAAFYWKRATEVGAVASMIGGTLTTAVWFFLKQPFGIHEFYPGLVVAVALLVIVSLATAPPSKEVQEKFHGEHMSLNAEA